MKNPKREAAFAQPCPAQLHEVMNSQEVTCWFFSAVSFVDLWGLVSVTEYVMVLETE